MSNLGRSHSQPYVIPRKLSQQQQQGDLPQVDTAANKLLLPDVSVEANTFEVEIVRNSLGLGFSIMGGAESPPPWTHLVRIKKLFPLQPAWQTGKLRVGDILLKVSGVPLTGLTLRQSLDILRTSPVRSTLTVCRVPNAESATAAHTPGSPPSRRLSVVRSYSYTPATYDGAMAPFVAPIETEILSNSRPVSLPLPLNKQNPVNNKKSSISEVDGNQNYFATSAPILVKKHYGEFTLELTKVNGSLGFTLSKHTAEESNILRHSIKALVKEPAISEPRLQPGDKLLSANGQDCDTLSHAELIQFLRRCPDKVSLRLYRDASRSQTPVSPVAEPMQQHVNNSRQIPLGRCGRTLHDSDSSLHGNRGKQLRYEAKEMVRSLQASRSSLDKMSPAGSYAALPVHRRGLTNSPFGWKNHQHLRTNSGDQLLGSSAPTIESPLSPECASLPPLFLRDAEEGMEGLRIEELSPNDEAFFDEIATEGAVVIDEEDEDEDDTSVEIEEPITPVERPHNLDLFGQTRKPNYQFHSSSSS